MYYTVTYGVICGGDVEYFKAAIIMIYFSKKQQEINEQK